MMGMILVLHLTDKILRRNIPVLENFWEVKIQLYPTDIWDKVFKNGTSEICGIQPLKNLK